MAIWLPGAPSSAGYIPENTERETGLLTDTHGFKGRVVAKEDWHRLTMLRLCFFISVWLVLTGTIFPHLPNAFHSVQGF